MRRNGKSDQPRIEFSANPSTRKFRTAGFVSRDEGYLISQTGQTSAVRNSHTTAQGSDNQ